jgi:gliding motility-associated-like protein
MLNSLPPNLDASSGGEYDINSLNNDVFFPYTAGVIEYNLQVYNRWGEIIFESDDIKKGWDGYYKGKLCQQDVYIWKAFLKLNNGKEYEKNGSLTLLY